MGCFNRMKANMLNHVESEKVWMFNEAASILKNRLRDMCSKLEEDMKNAQDDIYYEIRNDYTNVIAGARHSKMELTQDEEELRAELYAKIKTANSVLIKLAGPEWEQVINENLGVEIIEV